MLQVTLNTDPLHRSTERGVAKRAMSEHMLNSRCLSARCRGLVAIVSLLSALVICATPTLGRADTILPREYEGVDIENKLGAQAPLDLKFKDEQGREVTLLSPWPPARTRQARDGGTSATRRTRARWLLGGG